MAFRMWQFFLSPSSKNRPPPKPSQPLPAYSFGPSPSIIPILVSLSRRLKSSLIVHLQSQFQFLMDLNHRSRSAQRVFLRLRLSLCPTHTPPQQIPSPSFSLQTYAFHYICPASFFPLPSSAPNEVQSRTSLFKRPTPFLARPSTLLVEWMRIQTVWRCAPPVRLFEVFYQLCTMHALHSNSILSRSPNPHPHHPDQSTQILPRPALLRSSDHS